MPDQSEGLVKIGAIDIGTNAVRLGIFTIVEFQGKRKFLKDSFTRVPLRLGHDSFAYDKISAATHQRLLTTMKAFRLLMDVNKVENYKAVATSALRNAQNGNEILADIEQQANISVKIIGGEEEAGLTANMDYSNIVKPKEVALLIDLGGGSTELSIRNGSKSIKSKSFKIGTIRVLSEKVKEGEWEKMESWIKENLMDTQVVVGLAFGGNIKAIYRMLQKPFNPETAVSKSEIESVETLLSNMEYRQRIFDFNLKPDRADVLPPACRIFLYIMECANLQALRVPQKSIIEGTIDTMV